MPSAYVVLQENILRYLRNSLVIAVPVTLITVCLSTIGAYAMSRLRTRLVDVALVTILLLQVFPEALLATPVFLIFKSIGLVNTIPAVVLATSTRSLAFALVILRPMFRQVPIELEEASRVDGCTPLPDVPAHRAAADARAACWWSAPSRSPTPTASSSIR